MPLLPKFTGAIRALFHKTRDEQEMDEELHGYLEMLTREKIAAGMSPAGARRAAKAELGSMETVKEKVRVVGFENTIESFWQDLRLGLRILRKSPGFTAVAVLTLALGIGANTAIFSIVNAVLLRPLPFPDSNQIGSIAMVPRTDPIPSKSFGASYHDFEDWREQSTLFVDMAIRFTSNVSLTGDEKAERVQARAVSAGYFKMIGVRPLHGRTFLPEEDHLPGDPVVILSHALWKSRYGADQDMVEKSIQIDGTSYTVVGIAPESFPGLDGTAQLWTPLTSMPPFFRPFLNDRGARFLSVIVKLKSGTTFEQGQAEMNAIADRLSADYPNSNKKYTTLLVPLRRVIFQTLRTPTLVLFGAVGLVLLIACANVANLLLLRASSREKEFAVRSALGAGRLRIARQLLVEGVSLSIIGGAGGLLTLYWLLESLAAVLPGLPPYVEISLDPMVLGFALGLCGLTGVVFGLAPVVRLSGYDLHSSLKEGGRGSGPGAEKNWLRNTLVVSEMALALVLLIGAALLLQSLAHLLDLDLGFQPEGNLLARVDLPKASYPDAELETTARVFMEKLEALPSIISVSISNDVPLAGGTGIQDNVRIEGQAPNARGDFPQFFLHGETPDFFQTLGIQILRGRTLTSSDTSDSQLVAVISKKGAERLWPGENPLGKQILIGRHEGENLPWRTVVGVAADVLYRGVTARGANDPDIYLPFGQYIVSIRNWGINLRTQGDPAALTPMLTRAIEELDPNLPVYGITAMNTVVDNTWAQNRLTAYLLGGFSLTALLLAAIGIYGVMAFSVSQQTHEIGIRLALGARHRDILRMVVGRGMLLAGIGVSLGLSASYGLSRFLSSQVYAVSVTDPMTFAIVPIFLSVVALVACYIPARRATRVDPMVALRYE